jgi:hypothetical protein
LQSCISSRSEITPNCYSYWCGSCLQCIIDLKENVLRVGGGEVSVPFLQGWFSYLWIYHNGYFFSLVCIVLFSRQLSCWFFIYLTFLFFMFRERHTISVFRWGKIFQGSFKLRKPTPSKYNDILVVCSNYAMLLCYNRYLTTLFIK